MSAYELREWQVYDRLFPFGDERADWRMGQIASVIANVNTKRGGFKPTDFMLKPPQTQEQKDAGLKATLRKAAKPKKARRDDD